MKISRENWHFKVFAWWYKESHKFCYSTYDTSYNLCPYVRAIMVWAPIRFLFTGWKRAPLTIATIFALLNGYVYHKGGMNAIHKEEMIVILGLTSFAGVAVLTGVVVGAVELVEWLKHTVFKKDQFPCELVSFWNVLAGYTHAVHNKVCPLLTFTQLGEDT